MVARYNYHFAVGGGFHQIEVYKSYSEELGLKDLIITLSNGNFSKLSKELSQYFTKEQIVKIKSLAKYKEDNIIDENCKFHSF